MDAFKQVGLALATAVLLVCSFAQAAPTYTITDLGSLSPVAINDHGQVAGYRVVWESGNVQGIPGLSSLGTSIAADINDSGQVVGSSQVNSQWGRPVFHPYLYDSGTVVDLSQSLGLSTSAYGMGINNNGTVVGILESGSVFKRDGSRNAGTWHPNTWHAFSRHKR